VLKPGRALREAWEPLQVRRARRTGYRVTSAGKRPRVILPLPLTARSVIPGFAKAETKAPDPGRGRASGKANVVVFPSKSGLSVGRPHCTYSLVCTHLTFDT